MEIFAEVKRRVGMTQAAEYYGYPPNRSGFIRCPFHGEKTPSLKLWPDHWHCFGCGKGGSAVDFVALLFELKPLEAAKKLNADLALGLTTEGPETREARQARLKRARQAETRREWEAWREGLLGKLCAALRLGNEARKRPCGDWTAEEAEAVRWSAALEYWLEQLDCGDGEAQMEVFRDRRRIEQRCMRILKGTRERSGKA